MDGESIKPVLHAGTHWAPEWRSDFVVEHQGEYQYHNDGCPPCPQYDGWDMSVSCLYVRKMQGFRSLPLGKNFGQMVLSPHYIFRLLRPILAKFYVGHFTCVMEFLFPMFHTCQKLLNNIIT